MNKQEKQHIRIVLVGMEDAGSSSVAERDEMHAVLRRRRIAMGLVSERKIDSCMVREGKNRTAVGLVRG